MLKMFLDHFKLWMWMCIGFQIYVEAKAEADMEQTFQTLLRHWKGAVFHHTRFIVAVPQQQSPQEGDAKDKHLNAPKHHIKDGETFTILGKFCTLPIPMQRISTIDLFHSVYSSHIRFREYFGSGQRKCFEPF